MTINVQEMPVGTIFTSEKDGSPDIDHYWFILDENAEKLSARQGMYCYTKSEAGIIIGLIQSITVRNQYYEQPHTVKNLDSGSFSGLSSYFPSDRWEDYIGLVRVLGTFPISKSSSIETLKPGFYKKVQRSSFPAKPGGKVFILSGPELESFLGLDPSGLHLGTLDNYDIDVNLNINRLINKHLAVLAMSGAGKSYLVSDMIEELLLRDDSMGTPGVLLIDVHGEYKFFSDATLPENKKFAAKTRYYDGKYFEIGVPRLSAYDFARYQPNISNPQIRELKKVLADLSNDSEPVEITDNGKESQGSSNTGYDINDIIDRLNSAVQMNQKVRDALVGWLYELDRYNLFSKAENPRPEQLIKPGNLTILDLSNVISVKKKRIIVSFLAEKLFFYRRIGKIPPFFMILEEAHQFAPEGVVGSAKITKPIIETIAREGRKFFAQLCLISQRPVKLSTTALSQCNTHIILRVTNPNDLDHIKTSSEALTRESLRMISTLPTGNALIMGSAVNMPLFFKARRRYSSNPKDDDTLEDICKRYVS